MASWADGILGALQGAAQGYGQNAQQEMRQQEEMAREERAARINRERLIEEFNMRRQAAVADRQEERAWRKEDQESERSARKADRDEDRAFNRETMSAQQAFQREMAQQSQAAQSRENALSRAHSTKLAGMSRAQGGELAALQNQLIQQYASVDPNSEEGKIIAAKLQRVAEASRMLAGRGGEGGRAQLIDIEEANPKSPALPAIKQKYAYDAATNTARRVNVEGAQPPQPSPQQQAKPAANMPTDAFQGRAPDGSIHWYVKRNGKTFQVD